ncbi:MAG: hypothetical protein Q8O31_04320 [Rhodocyclaceae bacterium]|nr:hypothetical protein [Rhodocyclaceae bacterium]
MSPTIASTEPLTFEHVWQLIKETREMFQESKLENDRLFRESRLENDRLSRVSQESKLENDRILKNLSKQLGDLGNRLGEFVEHMVAPAVVRLFQSQGIEVHTFLHDVESHRNGEGVEIDLLVINDGVLVAVECKSKLTKEHVDEHLVRMEKLKRLMPEYRHHKAWGAVAAMVISDSVKNYAHSHGLFVLYQNGEAVEISIPTGFEAQNW